MSKPVIYSSQLINAKPEQYSGYDYGYILEKHDTLSAYDYDSTNKMMYLRVMSNNTNRIVTFDISLGMIYPYEINSVNFICRYNPQNNKLIEILIMDYSRLAYRYAIRYGILTINKSRYETGFNY